ncbi:MAG: hypothetical protein PHE55_12685 [Methylococcaceae bacterium]|nr:hypothetical protein [Methylococcaceae bacterium]
MHIEAELDEIHAQRLLQLQRRYGQPLSLVLARLIDSDWKQAIDEAERDEPSPLFQAFENAGLIGCIGTGEQLSAAYKEKLDYAEKFRGGTA